MRREWRVPTVNGRLMDSIEARAILAAELARYRAKSYVELQRLLGNIDVLEVRGGSGTVYQIEIEVVWDGRPFRDLLVMGGIDDGSLRAAFGPLIDSFIVRPDGSFVGE